MVECKVCLFRTTNWGGSGEFRKYNQWTTGEGRKKYYNRVESNKIGSIGNGV